MQIETSKNVELLTKMKDAATKHLERLANDRKEAGDWNIVKQELDRVEKRLAELVS